MTRVERVLRVASLGCTLAMLGHFAGSTMGACEAKCGGVTYFTSIPSFGGPGKHFKIITEEPEACMRIWWHPNPLNTYANNTPLYGYQYKEALTSSCTVDCYANGGLWGRISCSQFTPKGDAIPLSCWEGCQPDDPNP